MLLLPYERDRGTGWTKSLKRNLNIHVRSDVKTQVTFIGWKRSTQFNVKDRSKFEHKHVIYFGKYLEQNYADNYLGESARTISERIMDHAH